MAGLLASCGERQENNYYYYSPGWTRDGKVIFVGALESIRKDFLGSRLGYSYSEWVKTIYPSGSGESSVLFDVTGDPAYQMSCSPTGDYVAYLGGLSGGLYSKIVIQNIASGQHTGLEKIELLVPGLKAFDWSSGGTQLVYCTTQEVHVRNWNDYTGATDTLVTAESLLTYVSWRYGNQIAFVHDSLLSLINADGSGRLDLAAAASVNLPQILSTSTREVYGLSGGSYCSVDTSAAAPATTEVKSSFTGVSPKISPDGTQIVYDKAGESSGIYLLDLSSAVETKLK
jgi:hypothetical protein